MQWMINGEFADALPATDRGLHYGDGLFETIAIDHGRPCLWQAHMRRLQEGCQRLGIAAVEPSQLYDEVLRLAAGQARAVVKLIITRGSGGRGYRLPEASMTSRLIALYPWPDYPQSHASEGVVLWRCQTPVTIQPRLAGLKHLNRLDSVMARREWGDEAAEGVMEDGQGQIIEGTMSNLFFVTEAGLHTPQLSRCGVAGVMRAQVLAWAEEQGIATHLGDYCYDDLQAASEMFICNSLIGIWPVRQYGEHRFAGRGRMTAQLQQRNLQSIK